MEGYNGWANRSTWLVNLWIDNEETTYWAKTNWLKEQSEPITAQQAKKIGRWFLTHTIARGALDDGCNLDEVDWDEIAESWEAERLDILEHA